MPKDKRPAAMGPDEFRRLLDAAGITPTEAAERLCVGRTTVWRWLNNKTPISRAHLVAIRARIRPRKS